MSKILVVDDDAATRLIIQKNLQLEGYEVSLAVNGEEALEKAWRLEPAIVICDWMMPKLDGVQVCRQVKKEPSLASTFFILLTHRNTTSDRVLGLDAGADEFLTKPIEISELSARVRVGLRQHQLIEQLQQANQRLTYEQEKSERLLCNILPVAVAERLKQEPGYLAQRFEDVTVLFADLVNFTPLAVQMQPLELLELLNQIFSQFDQLAQERGLEKIKTIGDAYMVAGGLPIARADHAEVVADMALAMQSTISSFKTPAGKPFQLRIGIHSGPVIAGVIGINKFSYDLWGDTVNIASRMESQGIANKIQVTASTQKRLKKHYRFQERGFRHIKGKGKMKTYLLVDRQMQQKSPLVYISPFQPFRQKSQPPELWSN